MTGSQGETGTTTSTTGPTGQARDGQQQQSGSTATDQQPNTGPGSTFTQEQVNQIVADRLNREKAKVADYDQLKERAANWDKFLEESKTEGQKALDQARQEAETSAYAKARTEFGSKLVDAHLRAAATGRITDGALSALLGGVNTANFLTDKGDVDTTKISQFIDGIAPTTTPSSRPGGFGQGPREGAPARGIDAGRAAYEARHVKGQAPPLF